ncbi:MAG TPA: lysylphosphatidylglycerol synthase transmembrane domain-containing protein [Anaeromyxobacter sp.]|nr:lysylphosphatidylglycerol synthase transmembrane domain-containing protein [Anaeromyxobacter sp.]
MRSRLTQALLGLFVSAVALWLTLRGKDLGQVWQAMRGADYRYLLLYLPFWAVIHLSRTWRWGILLEPVAKVRFGRLNAASAVGWMALVLLPFRLGELARPYLVSDRPRLRVAAALSSVVVERVADGLFMALVLMGCLLGVPSGSAGVPVVRAGGVIVGLAFLAALTFLVVAYRNRQLAARVLERTLGPLSPRLASRAAGTAEAFIHGLRIVPSRKKVLLFFALTGIYWWFNGWGMQVLAEGFGMHLDLLESATLLGVLVIGVMIPAGPGMLGTFQGAILIALGLFLPRSVVSTTGLAYANVLWALQLALQVGLGLVFLFSRHIRMGQILLEPAQELGAEQALAAGDGERGEGQPAATERPPN